MTDQEPGLGPVVIRGEDREVVKPGTDFDTLARIIESLIKEFRLTCGVEPVEEKADIGVFRSFGEGDAKVDVRSSRQGHVTVVTHAGKYEIDLSTADIVMQHVSSGNDGEETLSIDDDFRGVDKLSYVAGAIAKAKLSGMRP